MELTEEQWDVLKLIIPVPLRRADGRGLRRPAAARRRPAGGGRRQAHRPRLLARRAAVGLDVDVLSPEQLLGGVGDLLHRGGGVGGDRAAVRLFRHLAAGN